MRINSARWILVVFASVVFAYGQVETPPEGFRAGDPVEGRRVFVAKSCHECHAIWGTGGALGPDLAQISKGHTFPQIAGTLWSHTPGMIRLMEERGIERPRFSPTEFVDLVSYLYYLSYFDEPGDATRGAVVYREKGCADCHDVGPQARPEHSPLNRYAECFSPVALARDMWNAAPAMRQAMEGRNLRPYLQGHELADILAYLNMRARSEQVQARQFLRPGDSQKGAALFKERQCAACHSVAEGDSTKAPSLARNIHRFTVTESAGVLWNHAFEMMDTMADAGIAFQPFANNELSDLIAYLFFLPFADFPGDVEAGRVIFEAKGCAECHAVDGIEWAAALPGAKEPKPNSPAHILAAFWNHAPMMEQGMRTAEIPWPQFAKNEMRDLLTYMAASARQITPPKAQDGR